MSSNTIELQEPNELSVESKSLPFQGSDSAQRSQRWRRRGTVLLLTTAMVGTVVVLRSKGVGSSSPTPRQPQALPVNTLRLQPVTAYQVSRTFTGEIEARRSSALGFEQSGTLVQIAVEEGDRVTIGTPMAKLDIRNLAAQRQQLLAQQDRAQAQLQELQAGPRPEDIAAARAGVADLKNQLLLAQRKQDRRQMLYDEGAISREALDEELFNAGALDSRLRQAQSQLNQLLAGTRQEQLAAQAAQVQQLQAQINNLDIQLAKSQLKAPFNGRIAQRLMDEGVVVAAGQSVFRLVEEGAPEARIGVPTAVAQDLRPGQRRSVQVGTQTYPAEITALLPELDRASRTVTVVLQLETLTHLPLGQTARLVLTQTQAAQGYWLPSAALVAGERGLWSAYVVTKTLDPSELPTNRFRYRVARRDVEVLHTEGDRVLVRGMLQPGEQVINSGTHRIVPGQWVQVSSEGKG